MSNKDKDEMSDEDKEELVQDWIERLSKAISVSVPTKPLKLESDDDFRRREEEGWHGTQ